jgi:PAS domain S-box-containing protein
MTAEPKWSSDDASILDASPTPIFVKDSQRRYVVINTAAAALMGRPASEILGRTDADFFPEVVARRHWAEDDAVLASGEPLSVEEQIDELAAGPSTILVRKTRTLDSAGHPLLVCTVTDITSLRAAQRDVRKNEVAIQEADARSARVSSILRSVLESYSEPFFSLDRAYRYSSFNAAHAAMMRGLYGAEIELGGRLPDYQRVPGDWEKAKRDLDRALAGEAFVREDFAGDDALTRRFFEVSLHPVRDAGGLIIGAAVFARDTTERRRAADALRASEEQLRQSQKMEAVGRLAGGVAHDFNNMLSVILSSVSFMAGEGANEGPLAEDLDEINKAAQRAKALTSQLLSFSRRQVRNPVVFDVNARVRDLGRLLQRVIGEDIEMTLDLSPAPSLVSADPSSFDQVMMNLIVNARDAMPTGGTLVVRTGGAVLRDGKLTSSATLSTKTHVMIKVSDSGHGMTGEVLEHLFEPFFTTKGPNQGTGLGLSIVYGAVQRAGGTIEVSSVAGQGSIFTIYMPIAVPDDAQVSEEEDVVTPRARPNESVLVVEDDAQVLRAASRTLKRLGYEVFSASNLAEAVERTRFAPSPLSVLVTDVVLPGGDGLAVSRAVTEAVPGIPVIFMSGFPDEVVGQHGVTMAKLQKPFTPDVLGRKVRKVLDAARVAKGS